MTDLPERVLIDTSYVRSDIYEAELREARLAGMQAAKAAVAARHMGDNNREDLEVLRCIEAIDALIEKEEEK